MSDDVTSITTDILHIGEELLFIYVSDGEERGSDFLRITNFACFVKKM